LKLIEGLRNKTILQHLLFLKNMSIVQACKELKITPQQFSDWIKKRRPIPVERLNILKNYFNIESTFLVDEKYYVKDMSALDRVEIEILFASRKLQESELEEEKAEYQYMVDKLEKERVYQFRIARLARLINTDNKRTINIIDRVIDKLEKNDFDYFNELIR